MFGPDTVWTSLWFDAMSINYWNCENHERINKETRYESGQQRETWRCPWCWKVSSTVGAVNSTTDSTLMFICGGGGEEDRTLWLKSAVRFIYWNLFYDIVFVFISWPFWVVIVCKNMTAGSRESTFYYWKIIRGQLLAQCNSVKQQATVKHCIHSSCFICSKQGYTNYCPREGMHVPQLWLGMSSGTRSCCG